MLDEAHEEVRRIAHNMMPDALSKLGLIAAIEDLAESYRSGNGLLISVQDLGLNTPLDASQEIMLFRITQELLQNIIKHAKATHIFIQLSQYDNNLVMTIEDNGIGFDLAKSKSSGGIGLKSMESRVAYLGGTIEIETAPGKGTVSIIQIPVKA
jgi:signal transduction histidine kinase